MAVKSTLNKRTDFTGEFPESPETRFKWRFEDEDIISGQLTYPMQFKRHPTAVNWSPATSGTLLDGRYGKYARINIVNPATERTHFAAENDGSIFADLGDRLAVGGWINPTTYSVGTTFVPLLNTRMGTGHPILYISLHTGRLRMMAYNAAGSLILDQIETAMPFSLLNGGWYWIGAVIEINARTSQFIIADRSTKKAARLPVRSMSGEINRSCTANIILGMHDNQYWFAGGLDEWFFEADTKHTIESLHAYIVQAMDANGSDTAANVLADDGGVVLRRQNGEYPENGQITTMGIECSITGTGRVSVTSQYTAGVTSVSPPETSTSSDGIEWTEWQPLGTNGELNSPNLALIRYRAALETNNGNITPRLINIQLFDIPIPAYAKLGFARPILRDKDNRRSAVLENAYDVIVTSEINGAETLSFKLPFKDNKRAGLENELRIEVVDETYRARTVDDARGADGGIVTQVYAEAAFYDLGFSEVKFTRQFHNALPVVAMRFALDDTGWRLGDVTVTTRRTWECTERNALAILRQVQDIHGGDLIFNSAERTVSLLTFSGKNSGALFAYKKNMTGIQRTVDTKSLATRVWAFGENGITFANINGGKPYVEDFTYTDEVRNNWLDCSNFTDPSDILEFAKMRLAEYSRPRVSYVINAMDLSVLTGYEHEEWSLGDIVTVDDREMGITLRTRIIRREYNLQEPWNTKLELSTKLRELGSATPQSNKTETMLNDMNGSIHGLQQDIRQMVPFNLLRNSRADDGFAYWINSGFEIDTQHGITGDASFKASGVSGTKYMEQTVYPDNRRNYTISAQFGGDNLIQGANGMAGIEVIIEFENGTTENKFIDFFAADQEYVIENDINQVTVVGGIPEAPKDGRIYGRQDAGWTDVADGGSSDVLKWTAREAAANDEWYSVCFGDEVFVAVSFNAASGTIMTSPDGIKWVLRTAPILRRWAAVCYGNGLFVAVPYSGGGVITSPDGVNWMNRTAPSNAWMSVCYGNGLFVAVGFGTNHIMTSPDGINWTLRTAPVSQYFTSVYYGNGLFAAVGYGGDSGNPSIITSPDGINWTVRFNAAIGWGAVCYGNGLFVAAPHSSAGNVMISSDGINWNSSPLAGTLPRNALSYGNGLFVAVGNNNTITSPDGINWTFIPNAENTAGAFWRSVYYGNGRFVAVSSAGTGNRIMTSS